MEVLLIIFLAFWLPGAILVGYVASQKGRDALSWGALSLIVSPLITLIALAVLPSPSSTQRLTASSTEGVFAEARVEDMTKKCPDCAETIKLEAVVCRYCGHKWDADEVRSAVEGVKAEREVRRKGAGFLESQRVTDAERNLRRLGLNIQDSSPAGVLVTAVIPGMPGYAAGLQPGDVIVSVDGTEVNKASAVFSELSRHAGGETGSIEVLRNGSRYGLLVT